MQKLLLKILSSINVYKVQCELAEIYIEYFNVHENRTCDLISLYIEGNCNGSDFNIKVYVGMKLVDDLVACDFDHLMEVLKNRDLLSQ